MPKKVGKLARRYAKALLRSVEAERGTAGNPTPAQQTAATLTTFVQAWNEDAEMRALLLNPMFEREQRSSALQQALKQLGMAELEQRFFAMLFERDRVAALPEIIEEFAQLADGAAGLVPVQVTTARAIDADEVNEIESSLRKKIEGQVTFRWQVDPSLLGGIIVRFKGKVLDGSFKRSAAANGTQLVGISLTEVRRGFKAAGNKI